MKNQIKKGAYWIQRSQIPEEIELIGEIDTAAAPRIPRFLLLLLEFLI